MSADIGAKFGLVNPGVNYVHPQFMPRWYDANSSALNLYDSSGTARTSGVAGFFTDLAIRGVAVDSNFTGGVAKQIASLTGPGLIYHIVGPAGAVTDTCIFTLVIDGVTYTYTSPAGIASGRPYMGPISRSAEFTTSDIWLQPQQGNAYSNGWAKVVASISVFMPPHDWFEVDGAPALYFQSTAVISLTASASISGTANQERQSGVSYRTL